MNMIDELLQRLAVEGEAEQVLRMVNKLAHAKSEMVRASIPSLIVVAESGAGISSYGKGFAEIIDKSTVLQVKGRETFLELFFPKNNDEDEKLFFSSPQRASAIRNKFYGTFLISLEEYEGNDLLRSKSFSHLCEFIKENKENIFFIFHVRPEFNQRKQLISELSRYLNLCEVSLEKPDEKRGFAYITGILNKQGLSMDGDAEQCLRKMLTDISGTKSYAGYQTLNNFLDRLYYEAAALSDVEEIRIEKEAVVLAGEKMREEINTMNAGSTQLGFHM